MELDSLDGGDYEQIPLSFTRPHRYIQIFMPLTLLELKAQLVTYFRALVNNTCDNCRVSECEGEMSNESVMISITDPSFRCVFSNNTILLFILSKRGGNKFGILGKVVSGTNLSYRVQLDSLNVKKILSCRIGRVSRIDTTTHEREVEALLSVPKLPLLNYILRAFPGVGLEKAGLNSLSCTLQQRLKSEYNESQLVAISIAVSDNPFVLIQGPPGTGKTRTIIGVISALLASKPSSRVLVAAHSNVAVDEIVSRLHSCQIYGNAGKKRLAKVVRVGKNSSTDRFSLDNVVDEDKAVRFKHLSRARLEKMRLKGAEIVTATLSGCGGAQMRNAIANDTDSMFDVVIIDEAAQALELSSLIPLQLLKKSGKLIMVGDPKQLPPTVISAAAIDLFFQRSWFERMQKGGQEVVMLSIQYRMHPHISCFPSKQFYENEVIDGVNELDKAAAFHEENLLRPYLFFDVLDGVEKRVINSYCNQLEVEVAIDLIRIVKTRYSVEESIGIITPYSDQVKLLTSLLKECGFEAVEVNTIDAFQGRELDIVILSTVRSSPTREIGFLEDRRRLNVALTRAKRSLWILGNGVTLRSNVDWESLLSDCKERRVYISVLKSGMQIIYDNDGFEDAAISLRNDRLRESNPQISAALLIADDVPVSHSHPTGARCDLGLDCQKDGVVGTEISLRTDCLRELNPQISDALSIANDVPLSHSHPKRMFDFVYRRSKSRKHNDNSDRDATVTKEISPGSCNQDQGSGSKSHDGFHGTQLNGVEKSEGSLTLIQDKTSGSLGNQNSQEESLHEEGSRYIHYIPKIGDEVAYLRQGHQEYLNSSPLREVAPWTSIKGGNIKAVEICKVENLEYATLPGSGDSCCKMTLKVIDATSEVFNKAFKLTLPEVVSVPNFLVKRSRYEAAIQKNWTCRDKCKVWRRDEGEEDGSCWEGCILAVKPKSLDFPDSPWERYTIKYESDTTETHLHSPWELFDLDTKWEQPHIDD